MTFKKQSFLFIFLFEENPALKYEQLSYGSSQTNFISTLRILGLLAQIDRHFINKYRNSQFAIRNFYSVLKIYKILGREKLYYLYK